MIKAIFTVAACALSSALAAYAPDLITSLPGWEGDLPSPQYSGYLNATSSSHLHYWLVLSESNPSTDPLVVWFNGGPGCSSLDGFLYEHGPFEVDTSDYSKLTLRPYRWSSIANVLYIESPVGVGFSYSDTKDYKLDDDRAAAENRAAIEKFYEMYPEFKANKFFITGESYAGVYVPTLAEAIVNGEKDGSYTGAKLTGIAVGNGCTGTEVGICGDGSQGIYYEWEYLLGTGFISEDLKHEINADCDWEAASKNEPNALSPKCMSQLNKAQLQISNVDVYNIYGDCVSAGCDGAKYVKNGKVPEKSFYYTHEDGTQRVMDRIMSRGPAACIDSAAASGYLNNPAVWEAIHVKDPGFCWSVCSSAKGWSYKKTRKNLPRDTYPLLVSNIDVLIFNGDWDACVPYTDNEGWTEGMGYTAKNTWHAWSYTSALGNPNQVAGYAIEYDVSNLGTGSFEFITIRGGRHEVPESAPAQAMEMLTRFTKGESF